MRRLVSPVQTLTELFGPVLGPRRLWKAKHADRPGWVILGAAKGPASGDASLRTTIRVGGTACFGCQTMPGAANSYPSRGIGSFYKSRSSRGKVSFEAQVRVIQESSTPGSAQVIHLGPELSSGSVAMVAGAGRQGQGPASRTERHESVERRAPRSAGSSRRASQRS